MPHPAQNWAKLVWNNWNTPKNSLITWITLQEGLNIKDKLFKIGCNNDDHCCCCDSMPETKEHLFIYCAYRRKIRGKLEQWLGRPMPAVNDMVAGNTGSVQWKIMAVVMNAYNYNVWLQRNNARINNFLTRPEIVAKQIKEEARRRIKFKAGPNMDQVSLAMLSNLGL
ncbi:uncharacterized protein LOC141651870 [Silene latifolia]|uniref:uncharacterized protein LOC141651870 n=1 Tax=Silene latifolia TaxID=37657 RepID=UPI003D7859D9